VTNLLGCKFHCCYLSGFGGITCEQVDEKTLPPPVFDYFMHFVGKKMSITKYLPCSIAGLIFSPLLEHK